MPEHVLSALIGAMTVGPADTTNWTTGTIYQMFRGQRELTRAAVIERTGLARSTVALRLDELLGAGLIRPATRAASTGGRPAITLALDAGAHLVAGADFGASHVTIGLADLNGELLATTRRSAAIDRGPEATLAEAGSALRELLGSRGETSERLLAIGVGLPGPVEHSSGRPRKPPIMPGWDGYDVPGWFRRELDLAAYVDNDVNLMAVGERVAAWAGTDDLVYVKVSTGVGAGIVSGGRLQRGAFGAAGDLGHVEVPGALPVVCTCGNTGCLEAVASVPAVLRELGLAGGEADLRELVRTNDPAATAAVRAAGRSLGAVLSSVVSLLNPSLLVIGGQMAESGDTLLAGIREVVYGRATPLATEHLTIVSSRTGSTAGVTGAVRLALDQALSPSAVDAMLGTTEAVAAS